MKVLHVLPSLDPASGGPARSVPALCSAEAKAGADVSLVSFAASKATAIEGVETIALKALPGTRQGLTPAFLRAIVSATRSTDVMHVHSLWNPPTSVAMTVAKRRKVPYVISPRGVLQKVALTRKPRLKRIVAALGEGNKIQAAAGVHFLTEGEALSSRSFPLPPHEVVLPNGIDPDLGARIDANAFRDRFPELAQRRIVLFLGRLHWSKGLDLQLEAIARLAERRDDFIWVLIGPDEGEWPGLSESIRRRGLSRIVRWLGPLPHEVCLEAVKAATSMVMTSRHEAHSMSMNESLALGTPVVMADTVGYPAASDAGAALEIPAEPGSIATAIGQILDDDLLVSRLKESGAAFVRDFLAWPRVAGAMIAFYEGLLMGGSIPRG